MNPFVKLGVQAVQERNTSQALVWFERAHAHDPSDPEARAWLGQTLCSTGQIQDGVEHLAAAARRLIDNARTVVHLNIDPRQACETLTQLQHWQAFEQALPLARELAALAPRSAGAQRQLALVCGQINLTTEALAAAGAALQLQSADPSLQVLHASLLADARQYDAACDRLEALLQQGIGASGVDLRNAFRAFKELARCLDALGEYDLVMPQIEAAGALAMQLPEYQQLDRSLIARGVEDAFAGYTRDSMARFADQPFPDQPRAPVFLMGFFRSGTTLTQEVLNAHPDVFLADEAGLLRMVEQELHRLHPGPDSVPAKLALLDRAGATRLRAAYWSAAQGRYGAAANNGVFVDKFTLNTVELGLINTVFPDAKVLFVMRDPRDVVLSCVMQLMVPTAATLHLLTLQDTAALYALVLRWWIHIKDRLSLPWLEFRYEDAVADFEPTFRRVFAFLGLPWHDGVANFHQRAQGQFVASPSRNQVSQPLYRTSVARWRRYQSSLAPVQHQLAPFIQHFGYEPG